MASSFETKPPTWFWIVSLVLLLWECMGVWSWWQHWQLGPAAMGNVPTDWDIQYFAMLPGWYVWLFAVAVWTGFLGGVLLLARKAAARTVYALSLVATVLMFGYTFAATDLIAGKGMSTVYFPIFIIAMGFVSVWFAGMATRRGWLR